MEPFEKVEGDRDDRDIRIFTLSTCPWCKKTKKLLKSMGQEYYYCDLDELEGEEKEKAKEKMDEYNPRGNVPTIVIDDGEEVIIGFKEDKIKEVLENE